MRKGAKMLLQTHGMHLAVRHLEVTMLCTPTLPCTTTHFVPCMREGKLVLPYADSSEAELVYMEALVLSGQLPYGKS